MCLFLFLSLTLLAATVQSHPPLVIGFCLWRFMADYGVFFPHTSPDHANISTCVLLWIGDGGAEYNIQAWSVSLKSRNP